LLPSRVKHSPRRLADSLGLVIERQRRPGELDSLSWFVDGENDEVLWEKYFKCRDLGKDLVPVVEEFKASEEAKSGKRGFRSLNLHIPLYDAVPRPIKVEDSISKLISSSKDVKLFGERHPDKEYEIVLQGSGKRQFKFLEEIFILQLSGNAVVNQTIELTEGQCCVVGCDTYGTEVSIERPTGSYGLVVALRDFSGNKGFSSKL